jgi:GrpB-like predicted nucleotidyltransferase (UPF0157 family)
MKITIEQYNPQWPLQFRQIQAELNGIIEQKDIAIEHIGSTAIPGLAAKPIIDILIGITDTAIFDIIAQSLVNAGYIYYEKYNEIMPWRRFFVRPLLLLPVQERPAIITSKSVWQGIEHQHRSAHIHCMEFNSFHWQRHIAFREYIKEFPDICLKYQQLKMQLSGLHWADGNEYNAAKEEFILSVQQKAMEWWIKK